MDHNWLLLLNPSLEIFKTSFPWGYTTEVFMAADKMCVAEAIPALFSLAEQS